MDTQYEKVNTDDLNETNDSNDEELSWKPFLRQIFVASGPWTIFFVCGMYIGAPTVFIPQIRNEANSTAAVSDEMASWISSGCSYGAVPWNFVVTSLLSLIGRKMTCAFYHTASVAVSVLFFFSNTPKDLLIFEILQGIPSSGAMTVSVVVLAEYTSPKYRGISLLMKSSSYYWGIWVSNAIGTFFHWRYISVLGFLCSLYTLTVFLWPESPFYLAKKGRFEECKVSHRWLKGTGRYAEKELEVLINSHKNLTNSDKIEVLNVIKSFFKALINKEFYRPLAVCSLCVTMYFFSGKIVYTVYAIDILKRITNSEVTAYTGMLILDAVTVLSTYTGCYLSKILKRRTLLFSCASSSILFLSIMSAYLYLVHLSIISENKYVSISLLTGFSLSVSCGPVIMATSLYGELTPLAFKSFTVILMSLLFASLQSLLLKLSPLLFRTLKMHGVFLFFAISMSVCVSLLYKYLPETKDKTLQEIEEYFKDNDEVKESRNLKKMLVSE